MKLVLGADHGGFDLKENIKEYLKEQGIEFTDYGTLTGERCDYPDIAKKVAEAVADGTFDRASSSAAQVSASALLPTKSTASGPLSATTASRQNTAAATMTPTS